MTRETLIDRIGKVKADLTRLSHTLDAMEHIDLGTYPDNYEKLSVDAALRGEAVACKLRHLIYESTGVKKAEYLGAARAVQGVRISDENGVLNIFLPCLIPKRRQRKNTEYLTDPLYYALHQYAACRSLPKYRHCVVCFCHIYNRNQPDRRVRDYDNLELKQLLDVIAAFLMEDDTGLLCDAYNTTELGEADCTCISVMDQERFFPWLKERENRLKSISDF